MISPSGNSTRDEDFRIGPPNPLAGSCACTSRAREKAGGSSYGARHASVSAALSAGSSPGGLAGRLGALPTRPRGGHEGLKTSAKPGSCAPAMTRPATSKLPDGQPTSVVRATPVARRTAAPLSSG